MGWRLQQILFSSDASIAGRIGSRLQIQAHPPPQKMRDLRGLSVGLVPGMVRSGKDVVTLQLPLGGDIETALQEKDVPHLLQFAETDLPLPHGVADLLLLQDAGLRPHMPVDALLPPDGILLQFSVATAPHHCPLRSKGSLDLPLPSGHPQWANVGPPGPPSEGVLLPKRDAHPPLPIHLPDTGGARCCLPTGQAGTPAPLLSPLNATPLPPPTVAEAYGCLLVPNGTLRPLGCLHPARSGSSLLRGVADLSAGFPGLQSHARTRELRKAPTD